MLAACAVRADSTALEEAQAALEGARSDLRVRAYAAAELDEAEQALARASAAWQANATADEVDHLAYLAEQRAAIARARAMERRGQHEIDALSTHRRTIVRAVQSAADERQVEQPEAELVKLGAKATGRSLALMLEDSPFRAEGANLGPEGLAQITRVAALLRDVPDHIVLARSQGAGKTSNARAADRSEGRVTAVRNSLLRAGVDPQRIIAQGNGEPNPIASSGGADGGQPDGGIELVILDLAEGPGIPALGPASTDQQH
jgi:OOP family OmpA-OmpF porin